MIYNDLKTFKKDVVLRMIDLDITQTELSKKVGVSQAYLSDIINGKRQATATRRRVIEVLNDLEAERIENQPVDLFKNDEQIYNNVDDLTHGAFYIDDSNNTVPIDDDLPPDMSDIGVSPMDALSNDALVGIFDQAFSKPLGVDVNPFS